MFPRNQRLGLHLVRKRPVNIDGFREFIEIFSLFSNRGESPTAIHVSCPTIHNAICSWLLARETCEEPHEQIVNDILDTKVGTVND